MEQSLGFLVLLHPGCAGNLVQLITRPFGLTSLEVCFEAVSARVLALLLLQQSVRVPQRRRHRSSTEQA